MGIVDTRENVVIRFDPEDVFENAKHRHLKDHRHYVIARLQQLGLRVTKWGWEPRDTGLKKPDGKPIVRWEKNENGIKFMQADDRMVIEVHGIIGVNIERIDNATGDKVQVESTTQT